MAAQLQPFHFPDTGQPVRSLMINAEPWFVAKDVCEVVGISKYRDAVAQLDADERVSAAVDTPGGQQVMGMVNESGIYALMMISRSPQVKPFRRWVTHEVLPSIRKTGAYALPQPKKQLSNRELLKIAQEEMDRADAAEAAQAALEIDVKVLDAKNRAALAGRREAEERFEEAQPKIRGYEHLINSEGNYSMAATAQILNIPGVGRTKLFALLRTEGIFVKNENENRPVQEYLSRGYFVMKVGPGKPLGDDMYENRWTPLVTPKGLDYLYRRFRDAG